MDHPARAFYNALSVKEQARVDARYRASANPRSIAALAHDDSKYGSRPTPRVRPGKAGTRKRSPARQKPPPSRLSQHSPGSSVSARPSLPPRYGSSPPRRPPSNGSSFRTSPYGDHRRAPNLYDLPPGAAALPRQPSWSDLPSPPPLSPINHCDRSPVPRPPSTGSFPRDSPYNNYGRAQDRYALPAGAVPLPRRSFCSSLSGHRPGSSSSGNGHSTLGWPKEMPDSFRTEAPPPMLPPSPSTYSGTQAPFQSSLPPLPPVPPFGESSYNSSHHPPRGEPPPAPSMQQYPTYDGSSLSRPHSALPFYTPRRGPLLGPSMEPYPTYGGQPAGAPPPPSKLIKPRREERPRPQHVNRWSGPGRMPDDWLGPSW